MFANGIFSFVEQFDITEWFINNVTMVSEKFLIIFTLAPQGQKHKKKRNHMQRNLLVHTVKKNGS